MDDQLDSTQLANCGEEIKIIQTSECKRKSTIEQESRKIGHISKSGRATEAEERVTSVVVLVWASIDPIQSDPIDSLTDLTRKQERPCPEWQPERL